LKFVSGAIPLPRQRFAMNEILRKVMEVLDRKRYFDYGTVLKFDEKNYRARVRLASGTETDWLRVGTPLAGDGYGIFLPLQPGDEVVVFFPKGEPGEGFVGWRLWGKDAPPAGKAKEIVIKHISGCVVKITESGSVELGEGTTPMSGVITAETLPACLFTGASMGGFCSKTVRAKR